MADEALEQTRELVTWKLSVTKGSAIESATRLLAEARRQKAEVLIADARLVFGSDHVRSALYHAKKALAEGRNVSDSLSMETLLYLSGERQLNAAIAKMSPRDDSTELVFARLSGGEFSPGPDWSELPPTVHDVRPERLAEFGITEGELRTCPEGRAVELVLEKVAAVDVIKK